MIGKDEFKELVRSYYQQEERVDNLCKVFQTAFDNPLIDWGYQMFDRVLDLYFDSEGVDWISYFLYENPEKRYYVNEEEKPLVTVDDLWELIKEHRK